MAIIEELFNSFDGQTLFESNLPTSNGLDPGSFRAEEPIGHAGSGFLSVTNEAELPSKPRQTRNRTLREDDWEEKRELITSLYKTMKLENLIIEMRERHGFNAARSMYLRRIVQWKINKNFKALEKQAVIDLNENSFLDPDSNEISSIPSDRLVRYDKDRRRRARQIRKVDVLENINSQHVNGVVMNGTFLYSPSERPSELFLMRLREYVQVRLQVFTSRSSHPPREIDTVTLLDIPSSQHRLYSRLISADDGYEFADPNTLCKWLDDACGLAKDVLQQAHWRLLTLFGYLHGLFQRNPKLGDFTARFFADMAHAVYGDSQHCIVQLFRLFLQIIQQGGVLETAWKIAMDSVQDVIAEDGEVQALMQSDVIELYTDSGLFDSAMQIAKQSADFCHAKFGSGHYRTRCATFRIIQTHYWRREFIESYQAAVALLRIYEEEHVPPDEVCFFSAPSLVILA